MKTSKTQSNPKLQNQQTTPTLNKNQYSKLLNDIKTIIDQSSESLENNNKKLTITYWQIGKRITQEPITEQNNYQNSILKDLSNELQIEKTILSRSICFFKLYQELPKTLPLSWSHYRQLITIKDQQLRQNLEKQSIANKWSRNQLTTAIAKLHNQNQENQTTILKRPTNPTYLYRAKVLDIVDGDTIVLDIDLGFLVHKEQRIRLADLDCAEITTKKGREAYQFLRDKMSQLNLVMVKTHMIDIYGRYLGHIFYDPTSSMNDDQIFEKGVYLNEEILQKGFGEMV